MPPRRLRIEHAAAFFSQAQADLHLAHSVYQHIVPEINGNLHPCFCGIMACSQHAIEKAIKGFLIKKGILFPFTGPIIVFICSFSTLSLLP